MPAAGGPTRAASCSKASSHCPAKPAGTCVNLLIGAKSAVHPAREGALRTRVAHTIALDSAEPAAVRSGHAIEYRKTPFLILVKALVERVRGVGQFLQGRTGLRHGCGPLTQALDRVVARRPA